MVAVVGPFDSGFFISNKGVYTINQKSLRILESAIIAFVSVRDTEIAVRVYRKQLKIRLMIYRCERVGFSAARFCFLIGSMPIYSDMMYTIKVRYLVYIYILSIVYLTDYIIIKTINPVRRCP